MELIKIYCEYTNVLEEEYYVVNGKKEGIYKKYYPDGSLRKTCFYLNNEINGDFIKFYENGTIKYKIPYVNGFKNGKYIRYYENGNIETEATYLNNRLEGECRNYYENQQLNRITYYTQNLFMTTSMSYYINGNLNNIRTFTSYPDKQEIKLYFENMNYKIYAIGNETCGFLDDLIIYYDNGKAKVIFRRIDKMSSEKKIYDENGQVIETINYTKGENFTMEYQLGHNY